MSNYSINIFNIFNYNYLLVCLKPFYEYTEGSSLSLLCQMDTIDSQTFDPLVSV